MPSRELTIINKLGLHARASAKLVKLASSFPCNIALEREGRRVNGKSIMGVLMLAAAQGTQVQVHCEGEQAETALEALTQLIADRFDEEQ